MLKLGQKLDQNNINQIDTIAQGIVSSCEYLDNLNNIEDRKNAIFQICNRHFVLNHQCDTELIKKVIIQVKKLSDHIGSNNIAKNENSKISVYSAASDIILEWSKQYGYDIHNYLKQYRFDVSIGEVVGSHEISNDAISKIDISQGTKKTSKTKKYVTRGLVTVLLGAGITYANLDKIQGFKLKKINWTQPIEWVSSKFRKEKPSEDDGRGDTLKVPDEISNGKIVTILDQGAMTYDQLHDEYVFWGIGNQNKDGKKQRPLTTLQLALEQNKVPLSKEIDVAYIDGTKNLDHKTNAIRMARLMVKDETISTLTYTPGTK